MEIPKNILMPWTNQPVSKSDEIIRQMLRKKSIIDLFKCMKKSCAFTTHDGVEMELHLLGHNIPSLSETDSLSCPYCTVSTSSAGSLVTHVQEIHGPCRFQCLFCFYRAFEANHVIHHQRYYHGGLKTTKPTVVVLPNNEIIPKTDNLIEIITAFHNSYKLLSCSICHATHATIALFDAHVVSDHDGCFIECVICSRQVISRLMLQHLNNHRTDFHKCLYCDCWYESKNDMFRHLSDVHYFKAMFYAQKMERINKAHDIFVLENLGFDAPAYRLLVATYVAGGILLTPKMLQYTSNMSNNVDLPNRTIPIDNGLPKIVKVEGGIQLSADGSILHSTDSVSIRHTGLSEESTGFCYADSAPGSSPMTSLDSEQLKQNPSQQSSSLIVCTLEADSVVSAITNKTTTSTTITRNFESIDSTIPVGTHAGISGAPGDIIDVAEMVVPFDDTVSTMWNGVRISNPRSLVFSANSNYSGTSELLPNVPKKKKSSMRRNPFSLNGTIVAKIPKKVLSKPKRRSPILGPPKQIPSSTLTRMASAEVDTVGHGPTETDTAITVAGTVGDIDTTSSNTPNVFRHSDEARTSHIQPTVSGSKVGVPARMKFPRNIVIKKKTTYMRTDNLKTVSQDSGNITKKASLPISELLSPPVDMAFFENSETYTTPTVSTDSAQTLKIHPSISHPKVGCSRTFELTPNVIANKGKIGHIGTKNASSTFERARISVKNLNDLKSPPDVGSPTAGPSKKATDSSVMGDASFSMGASGVDTAVAGLPGINTATNVAGTDIVSGKADTVSRNVDRTLTFKVQPSVSDANVGYGATTKFTPNVVINMKKIECRRTSEAPSNVKWAKVVFKNPAALTSASDGGSSTAGPSKKATYLAATRDARFSMGASGVDTVVAGLPGTNAATNVAGTDIVSGKADTVSRNVDRTLTFKVQPSVSDSNGGHSATTKFTPNIVINMNKIDSPRTSKPPPFVICEKVAVQNPSTSAPKDRTSTGGRLNEVTESTVTRDASLTMGASGVDTIRLPETSTAANVAGTDIVSGKTETVCRNVDRTRIVKIQPSSVPSSNVGYSGTTKFTPNVVINMNKKTSKQTNNSPSTLEGMEIIGKNRIDVSPMAEVRSPVTEIPNRSETRSPNRSEVERAVTELPQKDTASTVARTVDDVNKIPANTITLLVHSSTKPTSDMQPSVSCLKAGFSGTIELTPELLKKLKLSCMKTSNTLFSSNESQLKSNDSNDTTSTARTAKLAKMATPPTATGTIGSTKSVSGHGSGVSGFPRIANVASIATHVGGAVSVPADTMLLSRAKVDSATTAMSNINVIGSETESGSATATEQRAHQKSYPSVPRKVVKLNRMQDGSLVLKFPSTSGPVKNLIIGKHGSRSVSTLNVPAVNQTDTTQNIAVLSYFPSGQHAKNKQSVSNETTKFQITNTVTHASNKNIVQKRPTTAAISTPGRPVPESINNNPFRSNAVNDIRKRKMVMTHLPVWDKYGIDLSLSKIGNIPFHCENFTQRAALFYSALTSMIHRDDVKVDDCYVCGYKICGKFFSSATDLKCHMVQNHLLLKTIVIACKYCDCLLCGIDSYVAHVNIHMMYRFVCFMCLHNHFLLHSVADHIKAVHNCNGFHLCYAHPNHNDPLKDMILLVPESLSQTDIGNYINRTIKMNSDASTVKSAWLPEEVDIAHLYNCGFCKEPQENKAALKKHIVICVGRNNGYYPCPHCEMRFLNWTQVLDEICRHLYFHGENLYECSLCVYKHFLLINVLEHAKKHVRKSKSFMVNIIREATKVWKCVICHYRTVFQQGVMEHMQNAHNLSGMRYICSKCDARMNTADQSVTHWKDRHRSEKVTMIEMYYPLQSKQSKRSFNRKLGLYNVPHEEPDSGNLQMTDAECSGRTVSLEKFSDNTTDVEFARPNDPPVVITKSEFEISEPREASVQPPLLERMRERLMGVLSNASCSYLKTKADDTNGKEDDKNINSVSENVTIAVPTGADGHDSVESKDANAPDLSSVNEVPSVQDSASSDMSSSATDCPEPPRKRRRNSIVHVRSEAPSYSFSSPRRMSRRVAAKSDYSRWLDNIRFRCWTCNDIFGSLADLDNHVGQITHEGIKHPCFRSGDRKNFRMLPLVRCLRCNKEDTAAALVRECGERHPRHPFVCVDSSDSLKCGLCSYRNESGKEFKFFRHFQTCHKSTNNVDYYEHINDTCFEWALCFRGSTPRLESERNAELYICNICKETSVSEISMGMHVASHILQFECPLCRKEFRQLKVLYYHFLSLHRKELMISTTITRDYEEQLREVLMVFSNGLIVSKREAQHTSVASLDTLKEGLQCYYDEQLRILETYKQALLLPIVTDNNVATTDTVNTCELFIRNQMVHPVLELKRLSPQELSTLQATCGKMKH